MARFFAKHLAFLLLTLLVVSFLVFALSEFSPGAVARKELGAYATQEQVDLLTRQMGLDRPLPVRYAEYLGKAAAGDLGYSARFKLPVKDVIGKHLGNTALLAALAFGCIVPLSMLLGIAAGMRESSRLDRAILLFSTVVASIPEFALGVFLASVFVVWLGWLPGTATLVAGGGWSVATQLVLPVAVIVLFDSGYVISMIRASMIEVMQRPYIRTAVLKGMPFRDVILRHAVRNAMINPITVIMLQINYLVAGVVVVETVDRKSTRLNSSHGYISYAVFCLKKKNAAAFPALNACERAGADASSAGMGDAGFENQKELTQMQLANQTELADMQHETQKEIAGIQSATSRQNTKDQGYAQNEMLAYQQKESTARVASIMEFFFHSKHHQVSQLICQTRTQAQ